MRIRAAVLLLLAAASAIAAGCGSSSSNNSSNSSTAAASAAAASSTTSSVQSGRYSYGQTASAAATPTSTSRPVVISTKHDKLGTILAAGPKHMTVYLFEADKGAGSACSAACAAAWPPVTGKPQAAGQANGADFGTITRSDGATQVTYKGHPLYYFIKDGDAGDAYGEGVKAFGAEWYVLSPAGSKVDNS